VFLLIVDEFSWEKLSLKYISKIGDRTSAHSKLEELGYASKKNYENFRYRQLILIFITISLELILSIFLNLSPASFFLIALISSLFILYATETHLKNELKAYRESIESDFPAIVEALTLALSAGESPLTSMQRISMRGRGALSREFVLVVNSVTDGVPFATALDSMGRRMNSVAVRRFVDSVVIAITRGAPLIEVLHSHAQESRDFQRNRVLSAASKAEISMMIPVVFLILPISILFALWPSLANLNLFAQG
jgi:tight adherence protein C